MRISSVKVAGKATYGVVEGDTIRVADGEALAQYPDLRSALSEVGVEKLASLVSEGPVHPLADVSFLPVVPNADKVFCIGINYASHIAETGRPKPEKPVVFMRYANSQTGAGQPIVRPLDSEQLDYEGELAVVIGRRGRRISRDEAFNHVAGYACYNDGSISDFRRHSFQFGPGKNFPNTGSFGPWLVTTDEIPDPSTLTLTTRLNGEVMQHAPISDLVFDVRALPNPHWHNDLRPFTGRDEKVAEFLRGHPESGALLDDIFNYLTRWLPVYAANDRSYVTVAIGCTGGRHRSVYITEQLAQRLRDDGIPLNVRHRELDG